jgi:demethylmenaquinone methyltransferase/2-methoxy-6-polyprenyl-1,4-benzoquinol methylase
MMMNLEKYEKYDEKNAYFNHLAHHWDETAGNDGQRFEKLAGIFERIECGNGCRVIDAGCGTGVLFPHILKKIGGTGVLFAVDSSSEMIKKASEKFSDVKNIVYKNMCLEQLDENPSSFDAVIAFAVFPHIEDKLSVLKKFRSLLKETGRLYIFHMSDTASLNMYHSALSSPVVRHDMMPNADELKGLMAEARFSVREYIDHTGLNFVEAVPCT